MKTKLDTSNLYDQLKQEFQDVEMDHHCTDLYVKYSPEIELYLKRNYEYFRNIQSFISQIDNKRWLDIPFAYPLERTIKVV